MDFVYPKEEITDVYDIVMTSFYDNDFVRIKSGDAYDSFLMAISRDYQNLKTDDGREKMKLNFINQFKNFLKSPSYTTKEDLQERIVKIFNSSNLSRNFTIKNLDKSKDVFDIILLEKEKGKGNEKRRGFTLFSKKMKKNFSSNCNFFDSMSDKFLREIIDFKLSKTEITRELGELKEKQQSKYVKNKIKEKKEVLDFMKMDENNLDPENLMEIIESNSMVNQDLILRILSDFMRVSIFICRPWSTEISVIKKFDNSRNKSNIIVYKLDGRVSLTGFIKNPAYETGGIMTEDGIMTNFHDSNGVVSVLNKIHENNVECYYMEKYLSYLSKIQHQSNMCELDSHYCDQEVIVVEEKSPVLEKKEFIFLDERPADVKVEIEVIEDDTQLPFFMTDYTVSQMRDALQEQNNGVDYSDLPDKNIKISYLNMYNENKHKDVDTIIQNIKSIIV